MRAGLGAARGDGAPSRGGRLTGPEASATPIRVLVVDDEADFAAALTSRLQRRGFSAAAVFSGAEAVRTCGSGEVDVVLLDLKMPGMDGLATLRELRRSAPRVRVIVLTGHGTVASGIDGMRIGAEDFLQKPADIETLCTAIVAVVERERGAGGPGAT
jgi:DNA-binding response OmpR family regulator